MTSSADEPVTAAEIEKGFKPWRSVIKKQILLPLSKLHKAWRMATQSYQCSLRSNIGVHLLEDRSLRFRYSQTA